MPRAREHAYVFPSRAVKLRGPTAAASWNTGFRGAEPRTARLGRAGARVKLVVGLGNPGGRYERTYHNAGQKALVWLLGAEETALRPRAGLFAYARKGGLAWARPLVYMNESGIAVREAAQAFRALPEEILVLHDDSDLILGSFRISFDTRSAGHKGVASIIAHLGTQRFWRARIGIRPRDEGGREKAEQFVLKKISSQDERALERVFQELAAALQARRLLPPTAAPP